MGIYDREYYQGERSPGMHLDGPWSVVGKLIALNIAVYVVNAFTSQGLTVVPRRVAALDR